MNCQIHPAIRRYPEKKTLWGTSILFGYRALSRTRSEIKLQACNCIYEIFLISIFVVAVLFYTYVVSMCILGISVVYKYSKGTYLRLNYCWNNCFFICHLPTCVSVLCCLFCLRVAYGFISCIITLWSNRVLKIFVKLPIGVSSLIGIIAIFGLWAQLFEILAIIHNMAKITRKGSLGGLRGSPIASSGPIEGTYSIHQNIEVFILFEILSEWSLILFEFL